MVAISISVTFQEKDLSLINEHDFDDKCDVKKDDFLLISLNGYYDFLLYKKSSNIKQYALFLIPSGMDKTQKSLLFLRRRKGR